MFRTRLYLPVAIIVYSLSGCASMRNMGPPVPRLLPEQPSLEQVIGVVNQNTDRVQSLSTDSASISAPGAPSLRANIVLQRPRRFRLLAETSLTGPEVDLGSNDQLFWFWVRRAQPPALYYCAHDQFETGSARGMIPVDPEWLIDAMGLTRFEPYHQHSGPRLLPNNRLEIRSNIQSPSGDRIKITIVDAYSGVVLQQHVYDSQGQRLATAIASNHRYSPASMVAIPTDVEIQIPRAELFLKVNMGNFQINRMQGNPAEIWAKPSYPGYSEVNLALPPGHLLPGQNVMPAQREPFQVIPGPAASGGYSRTTR